MKKEYSRVGKCIWCLKEKPDVSFFKKAHTISKQLGSDIIGYDICDSCNYYFGKKDNDLPYQMSIELAIKEILNVSKYILLHLSKRIDKRNPILQSYYFELYNSKSLLRIKKSFKLQPSFVRNLTRQFKKGIYEVFLQEYHRQTGNGLDYKFNRIREFVRHDKGNIPLYFCDNKGIYLIPDDFDRIILQFDEESVGQINDFGFYQIWFFGHIFYLEVTALADLSKYIYLKKKEREIVGSGFIYNGIKELKYITDLDFTLRRLTNP